MKIKKIRKAIFWLFFVMLSCNICFWNWFTFWNEIQEIKYQDILTEKWQQKYFNFFTNKFNWNFLFKNQRKNFIVKKNWDAIVSLDRLLWKNLYSYFFKNFQLINWEKNLYIQNIFENKYKIILSNLNNNFDLNKCFKYFEKIERKNDFPIIFDYSNYYISISDKEATDLITCYLKYNENDLTIKWEINTLYWESRIHNIWKWLWHLEWLWKKWEELSVYQKIWNQWWYEDWYAILYKDWKYIHELVSWWWLCWISSVLYQWILKWYNSFTITERLPHSEFRSVYYNFLWVDATIFWEWEKSTRDFKVINNHSSSILIQWYNEIKEKKSWFKYWVILWSLLPFEKTYFKYLWTTWKCIKNWIYWKNNQLIKTINSCYQWWIHN